MSNFVSYPIILHLLGSNQRMSFRLEWLKLIESNLIHDLHYIN
jgi:hypothetical protein